MSNISTLIKEYYLECNCGQEACKHLILVWYIIHLSLIASQFKCLVKRLCKTTDLCHSLIKIHSLWKQVIWNYQSIWCVILYRIY